MDALPKDMLRYWQENHIFGVRLAISQFRRRSPATVSIIDLLTVVIFLHRA
jgi:hypothetical protein